MTLFYWACFFAYLGLGIRIRAILTLLIASISSVITFYILVIAFKSLYFPLSAGRPPAQNGGKNARALACIDTARWQRVSSGNVKLEHRSIYKYDSGKNGGNELLADKCFPL